VCAHELKWEDIKQAILDYAVEKYPEEELRKAYPEFPYSSTGLSDELAFRDFIDWFILERVQPSTGKTIAREFAEKSTLGPEAEERIAKMENVRFGEYEILDMGEETETREFRVTVRDRDNELYEVVVPRENAVKFRKGRTAVGRMHPWGSLYRFAGVVRLKAPEPVHAGHISARDLMRLYERAEIRKAEGITLNPNSTLSSVLNRYPAHWLDGICVAVGIEIKGRKRDKVKEIVRVLTSERLCEIIRGLPDECKQALSFILSKEGWVRYGQLSRRFDSEIGYWWNENPPRSTLGLVRLHGLLFVGRTGMRGRMYTIAVVPAELRKKISERAESIGLQR